MTSTIRPLPDRESCFRQTTEILEKDARFISDHAVVIQGDAAEVLEKFPDDSVSLILTDPPYHSTKKANIANDRAFREDEDFLAWMETFAVQWKRILRPSGTIYVFCSSAMSARLEIMFSKYFRPIGHITWSKPNEPGYDGWKGKMKKEVWRSWYPHSERILMFEHGQYGSWEAYRRSPLGQFLQDKRKQAGLTMKALTEEVGAYGKVNHGGAVANWEAGRNIPSHDQYEKICAAIIATGKVAEMPKYEDGVRPMFLSNNVNFIDVWDFPSVRPFRGKHPAEKPSALLEHMIKASSYEDDVVLDCFAGSGSTAVAAVGMGRKAIAVELEEKWVERTIKDLEFIAQEEPSFKSSVASRESEMLAGTLFDV